MRRYIPLIALVFSLLPFRLLVAQTPTFRTYTIEQGLPSSEVYQIYQDSRKYIWVASNNGVSMFDGHNFRNFEMQDGLPENTIFEIIEDNEGRVWFVSFPFQLSYYFKDSIYPYRYNNLLKQVAGRGAVPLKGSVLITRDGGVMFGLLDIGLFNISPRGEITRAFSDDQTLKNSIEVIEFEDRLLTSMNYDMKVLVQIRLRTREINTIYDFKRSTNYSHGEFYSYQAPNREVYCAQNEFLIRFKINGEVTKIATSGRIIWLGGDAEGNIWVGYEKKGVYRYRAGDLNSTPDIHYLDGLTVSSVLNDTEGGIWFSTLGQGIYYLPNDCFMNYDTRHGLSSERVNCVVLYMGRVVAGTNDNFINVLDRGIIKSYQLPEDAVAVYTMANYKDSLLWIGSKTYLYSYRFKRKNKLERFINNHKFIEKVFSESRNNFNIKEIQPVSGNLIYLGESRSFTILKGNRIIYNSFLDDKIELRIEAIADEGNDSYLLGAFNGLWRWNKGVFQFLGAKNPIFTNRITEIVISNDGRYKVYGTKGAGVIIENEDKFYTITKTEGLSSNSITSMLIVGSTLWIATNNGLNAVDLHSVTRKNPHITVIRAEDGLFSNEINQIAGDSTHIYIASNRGLTVFTPSKFLNPVEPPPVYITAVNIMDKYAKIIPSYKLPYNKNFITVSFNGISFRNGNNLEYRYRLKGLNDRWISTSNSQVDFAFLPPGQYEFQVYALAGVGLENPLPTSIQFIIHPPLWRTWWFLSLVLLLLLSMIIWVYRRRLRQIQAHHELESSIDLYRQQSLSRQMDPHFVFNSLNSIQSYIMKNDRISASSYLSKFSKLMRLILSNSQASDVMLQDEIHALNLYLELESLRFQHKFEYDLRVAPDIDVNLTYIPAFLIQPFVENAIWHGIMHLEGQGRITIDFIRKGDQIVCTIEDNGVGRTRSKAIKNETGRQRPSFGINLVESRLKLLSGVYNMNMKVVFVDLHNDKGKATGTQVMVNLPLILKS
jgi:sensor histidine kinase YesM